MSYDDESGSGMKAVLADPQMWRVAVGVFVGLLGWSILSALLYGVYWLLR